MDDGRFDTLVRVLGVGAPRRRVLAGLLAAIPIAFSGNATAKKKKKCKGKKKCGGRCIPKSNCCTDTDCGAGRTCTNGSCLCVPNCTGKECGSDGCGDVCGTCTLPAVCDPQGDCCTPACAGKACGPDGCGGTCGSCTGNATCDAGGQCVCQPDCTGKVCGSDGCGGSCGTCQNGTCTGGQCVCPFPQSGATCSPGVCCAQQQACVGGACGSCPEAPDPCLPAQEHFCGKTTAPSPFCFCVTSVDDDTTCSSVFVNPSQSVVCDSDDDCTGILGLGVDTVCVHAPCLGLGIDKVCMNKGCVNLNASRSAARSDANSPAIRQAHLRRKR